jgi:hypothetical protein
LNSFLEQKSFIKSFLINNGYKLDEILEDKNIELILGCLMGYITEKEKRCLESMIILGNLDNNIPENLLLILRRLVNIVKIEVSLF